ncbi:MAG: class I SAM-dependent methyltransferase [Thermoplasmata archaeon]
MDLTGRIDMLLSQSRKEWENPDDVFKDVPFERIHTAVDLGCGPGFFTIPIAEKISDGYVYAIDANENMLEALKKRVPKGMIDRIKTINSTATYTGIESESVDFVFMANVFHDFNDRKAVLSEIRRILKNGGILMDLDWKKDSGSFGPPQEIRIDPEIAKKEIQSAGFDLISEFQSGPHHYGLMFKK